MQSKNGTMNHEEKIRIFFRDRKSIAHLRGWVSQRKAEVMKHKKREHKSRHEQYLGREKCLEKEEERLTLSDQTRWIKGTNIDSLQTG